MNTPSIHQVPLSANRSPEPPEHLPRLSRNSWDRPDLARLMDTENAYAPYITPRRQSQQ